MWAYVRRNPFRMDDAIKGLNYAGPRHQFQRCLEALEPLMLLSDPDATNGPVYNLTDAARDLMGNIKQALADAGKIERVPRGQQRE